MPGGLQGLRVQHPLVPDRRMEKMTNFFFEKKEDMRCHRVTEQDLIPKEERGQEEVGRHARVPDHPVRAHVRPAAVPFPTGEGSPAVRWCAPSVGPR